MSRNAAITSAVYAGATGTRGPALSWGYGVQHSPTRSNDLQVLVFVVILFGVLLALTVMLGAPIG
jgi:hypothetical protein